MNCFSENELERLLLLVSGELFYLEKHDKKDTNEFLQLKKLERKLINLCCRKA